MKAGHNGFFQDCEVSPWSPEAFFEETLSIEEQTLSPGTEDTNRPPKGDRSEGFYINVSIFIDFSGFWVDFIKNTILIYGN